ncbi:MAG: Uma2 family endonuclease [Leptolyngbyaceae bacterium]|nr:Uma2 family endonuclease [Leptolyngbyaceae bacterium]
MAQAQISTPSQLLTFEEYQNYQGEAGIRYELFRGQLIPMATPSGLHTNICEFLVYQFQRYFARKNLFWVAKTDAGVRTEFDSSRIPDVIGCSQNLWERVCDRPGAGILDFEEVPLLVVEVVSDNWRQDYIRKRAEYALIEVPEYWIVDPERHRVWVLTNPESEDSYDRVEFRAEHRIQSAQLPDLALSVAQVLAPPLVEELIKQEATERQDLQQQLAAERQKSERLADQLRQLESEKGIP